MTLLPVLLGPLTLLVLHGLVGLWPWASRGLHWLATSVLAVLVVNAELWGLSLVPVGRPLDLLVPIHVLAVLAGAVVLVRRGLRPPALLAGPATLWRELDVLGRVLLLGVLGVLTGYALFGLATSPGAVDELGYHVPQAVMPYQDGRVTLFDSHIPWSFAYPQGAAMLWSWTLFSSGTDLWFHTVQVAFAGQFLLATVMTARRTADVPRTVALAGAFALVCMPVLFRMSTISTSDIGFAGGLVTALAFLAPGERPPGAATAERRRELRWAGLAFAQCCLIKIPVLAVAFLLVAVVALLVRRGRRPVRRLPGRDALLAATTGLVVLASCIPYLRNWVEYGNPTWPLPVALGSHVVFAGPLPVIEDSAIGASTTLGSTAEWGRARLWAASLTDWWQPVNEDSFGGTGPVVLVGLALLAFLACLEAVRRRQGWPIALSVMAALGFLAVPGLFVPRYGLALFAVVAVLALVTLARVQAVVPTAVLALVVVSLSGLVPVTKSARATQRFLSQMAAGEAWYEDRGRSVAEAVRLNDPTIAPSPAFVSFVRDEVDDDELLAYDVSSFMTLLWNDDYSNEIEFVPGTDGDLYPRGPHERQEPTDAELADWQQEVDRIDADLVVVYSGTRYAQALRDDGWRVAFADETPPEELPVTVLERVSG